MVCGCKSVNLNEEDALVVICSFTAVLITTLGTIISLNQKAWRNSDGILLFNAFLTDFLFSIFAICLSFRTEDERIFSNLYVFMILSSWANQALVTMNRYVLITYKINLNRTILTLLVVIIWFGVCIFIALSYVWRSLYTKPSHEYTHHPVAWLHAVFIEGILVLHGALLLAVYPFEFLLWHQNTTQKLQWRFSLPQNQSMAIKRKTILLLAQFVPVILYFRVCILFVVHGEAILKDHYLLCVISKICSSFQPVLNVASYLSDTQG